MTPRIPPNSTAAEQAVLGGLMLSDKAWHKVGHMLTAEDFYERRHGLIWTAVAELQDAGKPYDAVTMADWFESHGIGGLEGLSTYVLQLANATASAANIAAHADIVRDKAILRRTLDALHEATESAWAKDADAVSTVDAAIRSLMGLMRSHRGSECSIREAAKKAFQRISEIHAAGTTLVGVTTGLADLDEKLGGLHKGDLVVVGARPAMGKTAMLLGMALAAARAGTSVGFISAEQPDEQIAARAISSLSRVASHRLRCADLEEHEWARASGAVADMREMPLRIMDRSAPDLSEVLRTARNWSHMYGIKALYIDYLQRIASPAERRFEAVGEIARGLKNLARDLGIPVVVLAQVNRTVDTKADKRPRMGDLSDSSEIEKEADQILMLYRDEVYNADTKEPGIAEIIVEKNRHGPTGFLKLSWRPETMQFGNLARAA